jgi:hypothetical protein
MRNITASTFLHRKDRLISFGATPNEYSIPQPARAQNGAMMAMEKLFIKHSFKSTYLRGVVD